MKRAARILSLIGVLALCGGLAAAKPADKSTAKSKAKQEHPSKVSKVAFWRHHKSDAAKPKATKAGEKANTANLTTAKATQKQSTAKLTPAKSTTTKHTSVKKESRQTQQYHTSAKSAVASTKKANKAKAQAKTKDVSLTKK
jgi:hypothetical protein